MDFAELVLDRLRAEGENVNRFEAKMGCRQGFLRAFVREDEKRSQPTLEKARLILEALGQEMYVGPPRPTRPQLITEISGEDFAAVPRYDATLSAGPGADNGDDPPAGAIAFRRDWLDREGISAADAMVMTVKGDSMSPTLCDGDLVLIDRRRTHPLNRHIYALVCPEGQAKVKRIERLPPALLLHSDNEAIATEIIPPAEANRFRILGEVVWWGQSVRE